MGVRWGYGTLTVGVGVRYGDANGLNSLEILYLKKDFRQIPYRTHQNLKMACILHKPKILTKIQEENVYIVKMKLHLFDPSL